MEKVKGVRIDFIEQDQFRQLEIEWLEALEKGEIPMSSIESHEDLEKLLGFLYHLQKPDSIFFKTLSNLGLAEEVETEKISRFEKSIRTIAGRDAMDRILGLKKAGSRRLRAFLSYADPSEAGSRTGYGKKLYKTFQDMARGQVYRVRKSQKVEELARKYPDIDVQKLVSIGVLSNKFDLTYDDLEIIEQMIMVFTQEKPAHPL